MVRATIGFVIDHIGIVCADFDAQFQDAAIAFGVRALQAPRLRPEYHPGYFGACRRSTAPVTG